jgi:hypothetical protein
MASTLDLTHRIFGLLVVLGRADVTILSRNAFWRCSCQCGSTLYVSYTNLVHGHVTSCGCAAEQDD